MGLMFDATGTQRLTVFMANTRIFRSRERGRQLAVEASKREGDNHLDES